MTRRLVVLFVAGLAVRLVLAWLPVDVLIAHTLPDDAFIFFVISRNLAAGLGATFDGLQPTNGFHPLWPILTAPFFALVHGGDLPVHLALSLGAICDALAGGLTGLLVGRVSKNALAGEWALLLYLFNPRVIQESVNGLETGLGMLALAGCLWAWYWVMAQPDHKGRALLFGALAGLTLLARSDLAIISGLLWIGYALKGRRALAAPAVAAVAGLFVVTPWFAWSLFRFGTLVQSSAVAIPSLVAARIQSTQDSAFLWNSIYFPVINFSFRDAIIYPGIALLAAVLGVALIRWPNRSAMAANRPALQIDSGVWWPLIGAAVVLAIHTFVRWYPRGWYFVPWAWACTLAAAPLLASGLTSPAGRRFGWLIIGLLVFVFAGQSLKLAAEPEYAWQGDMRSGAEWLSNNTLPAEVIGAFNAGIYSYYSDRQVLSLDGLVDWGAIAARQQNRLLDYFVERGGSRIIEHRAYIDSFSDYFGKRRLEVIETLPVKDTAYGPIEVYRVSPP